jgi:ureidoacrylate peracid hydrolase
LKGKPVGEERWFESLDEYRSRVKPWLLDRDGAALLVIDLQNQFVEEGAVLEVPQTREIMLKAKELIDVCRSLHVPIVYTALVHESPELIPRFYELFPFLKGKAYRPGTREVEIYQEVAPRRGEVVVDKALYSAFKGTELSLILQDAGSGDAVVDTLILIGCTTNVCVETTARDAFHRDYRVVVVGDACAAAFPDLHNAALRGISHGFGRVMTTDEVVDALRHGEREN